MRTQDTPSLATSVLAFVTEVVLSCARKRHLLLYLVGRLLAIERPRHCELFGNRCFGHDPDQDRRCIVHFMHSVSVCDNRVLYWPRLIFFVVITWKD